MKLSISIPPDELVSCYQRVKSLLKGNDPLIFDSMTTVANEVGIPFQTPADASEFAQKHSEIEKRLKSRAMFRGIEVGISLLDEIASRVKNGNGQGVIFEKLLDEINLSPNSTFQIFLTPQMVWSIRWKGEGVVLGVHTRTAGEVVPSYVFEYINGAIISYRNGLYYATAALMSIVVEATLRDLLISRGYSYSRGASPVDIFMTSDAQVTTDGYTYIVTFMDAMPSSVADFMALTGGQPVDVKIRRTIKQVSRSSSRIDLTMLNAGSLADFWSNATPQQRAQKTVEGLGTALEIARTRENLITSSDLPTDFDNVIKIVRNNLIHLSGDIMNTALPDFPPPHNTLIGFLQDPNMIADLVETVTQFVNQQYLKLKLGIT